MDERGNVDLRELNFVQNKRKGDVLASFSEPVEPKDGKTVYGDVIEAMAAPPAKLVKPGQNTELSSDGRSILATVDGNAYVKSGAVAVEPVVVVENVDYSNGNFAYDGSVQVRKYIADGFTIRAGGLLEVGECAGRVTLHSDRQLLLRGGMNGGGEGTVSCDGDIYAKYIEGAHISCRGSLYVTDAIMHSSVTVNGNLALRGKHAEIIGGNLLVGGNLWCKKIGSISDTPTRIIVGIDPEMMRSYAALQQRSDTLHDRIDDLERITRHLKTKLEHIATVGARPAGDRIDQDRVEKSRAEIEETYQKVTEEHRNNATELQEVEARLKDLRSKILPSPKVRVVVEEMIYPRSTIVFGREEYRSPSTGADRTILKFVGGKIVEEGFNSDDPPDFEKIIGSPES